MCEGCRRTNSRGVFGRTGVVCRTKNKDRSQPQTRQIKFNRYHLGISELRRCGARKKTESPEGRGEEVQVEVRRCDPDCLGARPSNTSPFRVIYMYNFPSPPPPPHLCHSFFASSYSIPEAQSARRDSFMMRWCLALLLCCFLAVVNALSSSGSRLLVVLDESAEKSAYSTLWSDLKGKAIGSFCLSD